MDTPSIGFPSVKERLARTRVLVVLDDVDDVSQLDFLVGNQIKFGWGSRIIITTRDMHQLREMQLLRNAAEHDVVIYKMEELNHDEALLLFHLHGSKELKEMRYGAHYVRSIKSVLQYAAGIPLALKIWGSLFRQCESQHEWNSFLKKLKAVPDEKLQNVYRVSYDALGKNEKEIFIDIACFHKNRRICDAKRELNACGLFADIGIQVLIDMSFISVIGECLWMHDVVQEMGWAIVHNECPEEPGKRSRLYTSKEVRHVLENNTGTEHIQRMTLCISDERKDIKMTPRALTKMHNLKYLKFCPHFYGYNYKNCLNLQDLKYLPDSLKFLWWFRYPLKSLPSTFSPDNLVELSMPDSQLQRLWSDGQVFGEIKKKELKRAFLVQ